jgi:hypothetical protein
MGVWHAPNYGGSEKCATCFAGAVMAQTCRLPIHISDTDQYFDEATWKKFLALDDFRCGAIGSALYHLGVEKPVDVPEDIQIEAPYRHNPDLFRQSMRDLANLLRSHGL